MKTCWRNEADEWSTNGRKITDEENLAVIRQTLDKKGPIILEHRFYRGSRSPDWFVFNEFEEFAAYLDANACAGDAIHVWSFSDVCKNDNSIAHGKCPDDTGCVPRTGAY